MQNNTIMPDILACPFPRRALFYSGEVAGAKGQPMEFGIRENYLIWIVFI